MNQLQTVNTKHREPKFGGLQVKLINSILNANTTAGYRTCCSKSYHPVNFADLATSLTDFEVYV